MRRTGMSTLMSTLMVAHLRKHKSREAGHKPSVYKYRQLLELFNIPGTHMLVVVDNVGFWSYNGFRGIGLPIETVGG